MRVRWQVAPAPPGDGPQSKSEYFDCLCGKGVIRRAYSPIHGRFLGCTQFRVQPDADMPDDRRQETAEELEIMRRWRYNLEHLLPDAALTIAELLAGGPGLRILATSRAPTQVPGEQLLPLAPLSVPGSRTTSPLAVADSPAVSLFVERVRAGVPDFELTGDDARDVADLHHPGRPAPGPGAGGVSCAHPRAGRGADPQPPPV